MSDIRRTYVWACVRNAYQVSAAGYMVLVFCAISDASSPRFPDD